MGADVGVFSLAISFQLVVFWGTHSLTLFAELAIGAANSRPGILPSRPGGHAWPFNSCGTGRAAAAPLAYWAGHGLMVGLSSASY